MDSADRECVNAAGAEYGDRSSRAFGEGDGRCGDDDVQPYQSMYFGMRLLSAAETAITGDALRHTTRADAGGRFGDRASLIIIQ